MYSIGSRSSHEKGQFYGRSAHWKVFTVSAAVYAAKGIIQFSITLLLRDCCSQLQFFRLVDATLHCPPWKTHPCDAAFRQNSLTTCFLLLLGLVWSLLPKSAVCLECPRRPGQSYDIVSWRFEQISDDDDVISVGKLFIISCRDHERCKLTTLTVCCQFPPSLRRQLRPSRRRLSDGELNPQPRRQLLIDRAVPRRLVPPPSGQHARFVRWMATCSLSRSGQYFNNYTSTWLYVSPPYCRAERYAGGVACCPQLSHGEYAEERQTDRRTDGRTVVRPLHYAFLYGHGQHNNW